MPHCLILLSASEVESASRSTRDVVMHELAQALEVAGHRVSRGGGCDALVHQPGASDDQAGATAPEQVVVLGEAAPLLAALQALQGEPTWPVTLLGPSPSEDEREALLAAGLAGWWPWPGLPPAALGDALAIDRARWRHDTRQRAELSRARGQLDERKWVDRAKGVLMSARGIGEDDAFRLLRGAAMHANLRVGEVSRSVIEASQWAEAINRAGQLRMLSQRLVRLAAQRLAGIEARRARALQDEAAQRVQENLDHLASTPPMARASAATREAMAAVNSAWVALSAILEQRHSPQALLDIDERAMRLLASAEALTESLEAGGARRALKVVNLCGRQRMRVQRIAKDALLASLLDDSDRRAALPALLDEVEQTLHELEAAPLASSDSREALALARDEWLRLLRGLRGLDGAQAQDSRALLVRASDALLDVFDRLTASYEHSLQVIMS